MFINFRYTVGTEDDLNNGTRVVHLHTATSADSQSQLHIKLRKQQKLCRTNPEKCDRNNGSGKRQHDSYLEDAEYDQKDGNNAIRGTDRESKSK